MASTDETRWRAFLEHMRAEIDGNHVEAIAADFNHWAGLPWAEARERAQELWDRLTDEQRDRLFAPRDSDPCPTCCRSCDCEAAGGGVVSG